MRIVYIFLISFQLVKAQSLPKEFIGTLKINDSSFISYELTLNRITNSLIEGYSITDKDGPHETKSKVTGIYSESDKTLEFKEFDIVYTKSTFEEFDFCFVTYKGKVPNYDKIKFLKGKFYGKFVDNKSCIDGEILLAESKKLNEKIEKLKKKFDKPKFKKKLKIDSVQLKPIIANENINVFIKSDLSILKVYDSGKIDDDRINLYINEKLVLEDYSIQKEKKVIPLKTNKKITTIKIVALNEGTSKPNTVKVEIQNSDIFVSTKTALKVGENASLKLIKHK